jgi:hypothetical protein
MSNAISTADDLLISSSDSLWESATVKAYSSDPDVLLNAPLMMTEALSNLALGQQLHRRT